MLSLLIPEETVNGASLMMTSYLNAQRLKQFIIILEARR